MTRRERRRFKTQWDAQVEQERNGAPVPGEIAEQMTKPRVEALHQVVVTKRDGTPLAVGPMMIQDAAGMFAEAINRQVALGREKTWTNAIVVPCAPLHAVQ